MDTPLPALHPLAPGQLSVLRLHAAGVALALIAAGIAAEALLYSELGLNGPAIVPALLLAGWMLVVAPARRVRRWSWAFTGPELHVASGWLTRRHIIVPVRRVQHLDLAQGPVERRYGIATLILHTAGTDHSRVTVPGLTRADAEAIRDAIRTRIDAEG